MKECKGSQPRIVPYLHVLDDLPEHAIFALQYLHALLHQLSVLLGGLASCLKILHVRLLALPCLLCRHTISQ